MRRPTSVRARTTAVAAVGVGAVLLVAGFLLLLGLRASLTEAADDAALARLRDLLVLAEADAVPPVLPPDEDGFVQVLDADGDVTAASANLAGRGALVDVEAGTTARGLTLAVDVGGGRQDHRVWIATTASGERTVVAGRSLEEVGEATSSLLAALLVGLPLLLAILVLVTWLLLGRALGPVERLRAEVDAISLSALDRRVRVPTTGDEIARLAATMNAMLSRLDDAARRQREFVADASHELQSPLAALRTQLEVALAHPDGADWPTTATDVLAAGDRLERQLADLLYLARYDGVPAARPHRWLDLDDLVLDEVRRLPARAVVDTAGVSAAPIRGDADGLRRLVGNLLHNAVHHARSAVVVTLAAEAGQAALTVGDDGPGIPAADRERVFERFVRGHRPRARDRPGGGRRARRHARRRTDRDRYPTGVPAAAGSRVRAAQRTGTGSGRCPVDA